MNPLHPLSRAAHSRGVPAGPGRIRRASALLLLLLGPAVPRAGEVRWTAQWIMHPEVPPQEHAVVLFRKTFVLPEKPATFTVHVSADNQYRLFVNGRYLLRGPARGDLSHWFYETVDLAAHLRPGENTLAAEVVNWGPKRSFTFFSQMTSFLLQGDSNAEAPVNTAGGAWKCLRNRAVSPKIVEWMTDRNTVDFGLYVGNPTDSVRADLHPWGWEKPGYDDSGWLPARWADVAGGRGSQHAGGILYGGGRLLVPRRTPLLSETPEPFAAVRRATGIVPDDGFLRGGEPLRVPAGRKVTLLLDHGRETLGHPELTVNGGRGARIQAMYAENLIVKNKSPKGNRNDVEGKRLVGIKDVFVPDGGRGRVFKPTYLRAFRYIQLDVETGEEPLEIPSYIHVACRAPLELRARFETGDPFADWIMEAGWRTAGVCAQDMLLSDAAYEQMQYTGDSRVHNLALLALSGDDRLTRNALVQFDQSRIPEGLTCACYPNPFHLIIPSYSLVWIDQVHDYMMWRDDREFIAELAPGIRAVLGWFERRRRPDGLLGPVEWWPAMAWPRHYRNGEPPGVRQGGNALYSLHYAYTLNHAAEILAFTGDAPGADECRGRAREIAAAANRLCRNPEGFYVEFPGSKEISQITNVLAVLAGAVTGDEAVRLMRRLLEPKDWFGQVDLFLHLYFFEAMNRTGLGDRFADELSEWRLMRERGMTTFAEVPLEWGEENQRSECHPWSTAPNYFFFRTVCGIRPLAAGHREVEIAPSPGAWQRLKAVYPHPLGDLALDLEFRGDGVEGEVGVPQGMKARFSWRGRTLPLGPGTRKVSLAP